MPRKAIATPTEPSTTYFQAASRAPRPPREPTRKAVVMVVSSMATHIRPRLSATTARLIAARNRHSRVAKVPMLRLRSVAVRDAAPERDHGDRADDGEHPGAQRVHPEQPGRGGERAAGADGEDERHPARRAGDGSDDRQPQRPGAAAGRRMLTAASSSGRVSGIQIRVAISRATP